MRIVTRTKKVNSTHLKKKASAKRWRVDSGKCRGEEKNLVQIVADDRQAGYPCVRLGSEMGYTNQGGIDFSNIPIYV